MIEREKQNWRRFKESEPGHRFQDRYRRHQENRRGWYDPRALLGIAGGVVVVFGGLIAVPGPGPGWIFILVGLGMIAGEFRPIARFLDWTEVKLRASARWVAKTWKKSSTLVRVFVCLAILLCFAAFVYGVYSLFFGSSLPLFPDT